MSEELKQAFEDYIEKFKDIDIVDKKAKVISKLKEFNALISTLIESEGKEPYYLKSKEVSELNNGMESEDDFLEALLVYMENSENLLAQYLMEK